MSEEQSDSPSNESLLDLMNLNLGPAWVRDSSESKKVKDYKNSREDDHRGERRGGGRSNDRRDDRRGGGGFRRDDRRDGNRGNRGEREREERVEVEPPAGMKLTIMPMEESLDLLAKRVVDSGQTYSVFDLAKVLLQSRDRFRAIFESEEKPFFRCREDHSLWLSKSEAMKHLARAEWLGKFYEEVKVEVEAPKGNYQSVARCGITGQLLGPPNYHGYQERLLALHRERFGNMPLEAYKAKVQIEHGEEAVAKWVEEMKTVSQWKVLPVKAEEEEAPVAESGPEGAEVEAATEVAEVEGAEAELPEGEGAVEEEVTEEEVADEEKATEEAEEVSEEGEPESEDAEVELLADLKAVERHFSEHYFEQVFEEGTRHWVVGDIRGNFLSPGLLTLLKRGVTEEKRYPNQLMPLVCRQLSGRHVAVFKWATKLRVGPCRPHAVPDGIVLADRPQKMIEFLGENSGVELKNFWAALMPAEVTAQEKHEWFQDFQWLLSQGYLILLADTTVYLAKKEPTVDGVRRKRSTRVKGKGGSRRDGGDAEKTVEEQDQGTETPEAVQDAPATEVQEEQVEATEVAEVVPPVVSEQETKVEVEASANEEEEKESPAAEV